MPRSKQEIEREQKTLENRLEQLNQEYQQTRDKYIRNEAVLNYIDELNKENSSNKNKN